MIAAITLKMLDPFGTGKLVLFQVTYDKVSVIRFPLSVKSIIFARIGMRMNCFHSWSLAYSE
jgi:hypothetical protein